MTWELVPLTELCRPKQWPTISKSELTDSGFPVYGANGKIGFYDSYNHENETLLITCRGATCGTINVSEPRSYVTGNSMALDDLDETRVDKKFLFHALKATDFTNVITGVAQPQITRQSLSRLKVALPALQEQKRIAAILDKADELRAKRREAIAELDKLVQATFLDMFGECDLETTIADLLKSETLLLHKDGNHGSLYPRADDFGPSGVPFISARCISEAGEFLPSQVQFLSEEKASKLKIGWIKNGDVLLAHNASVGKTLLYRGEFGDALIGTSLTSFRPNPDKLDSAFLLHALRSRDFQCQLFANMGQTTRNQVPITAQKRLSVLLPPLDQQVRFKDFFESIKTYKDRLNSHKNDLELLFGSFQNLAFNGDL